jgi:hypothetical protein
MSFLKSMRRVFQVLKRMAVWAKNFEISQRVVLSVSVLVMNAKNARLLVVTAAYAALDLPALLHRLADRRECRLPRGLGRFADTSATAIDALLGWRRLEWLATVLAGQPDRSELMHRLVVAGARAVPSRIRPRCLVFKRLRANRTDAGYLHAAGQSKASTGAELRRGGPIGFDFIPITALFTNAFHGGTPCR